MNKVGTAHILGSTSYNHKIKEKPFFIKPESGRDWSFFFFFICNILAKMRINALCTIFQSKSEEAARGLWASETGPRKSRWQLYHNRKGIEMAEVAGRGKKPHRA